MYLVFAKFLPCFIAFQFKLSYMIIYYFITILLLFLLLSYLLYSVIIRLKLYCNPVNVCWIIVIQLGSERNAIVIAENKQENTL